jgi:hypothetical protein
VLIHHPENDMYYYIWVNSSEGIAHIDEWLNNNPSQSNFTIPGGIVEQDNTFNPGYSYRMDPETIIFGEVWMEVCDSNPCYLESDFENWVGKRWCPESAKVVTVWDCTWGDGFSCGLPVFSNQ